MLILKALNRTDRQTKRMLSEITLKLMASAKDAIEANLVDLNFHVLTRLQFLIAVSSLS